MRLIDGDALIESMGVSDAVKWGNKDGYQQDRSYSTLMCYEIKDYIDSQPTVDAAPVVRSRWIEPVPGDGFPYCGNCKAHALDKGLFLNPKLMDWYKTKYCPNCGARMDLEEQDVN